MARTPSKKKNPAAVSLGRRGGQKTSDAKTEAARANGKKGGHWSAFVKPPVKA